MPRNRNRNWNMYEYKIKTIKFGKDGVVSSERELYEGEYSPEINIEIDVCHVKQGLPKLNEIIDSTLEFGEDRGLDKEPYLHSHGEVSLTFSNSGCEAKNVEDFDKFDLTKLAKLNKRIIIKGDLKGIEIDPKIVNKFDILELDGEKIDSIPFKDKISVARLDIESNNTDLEFVKNIDFTPSNSLSRSDHYYTNGISVYGKSENEFFRRTIFDKSKCKVVLPSDLSNAEFLTIACNDIDIKRLKTKIINKGLKRLELNGRDKTDEEKKIYTKLILGNIDNLNTITNIDKSDGISTIEFNDRLTSVKRINNRELGMLFLKYEDLRGFPYEQFVDIIRNTAPASFNEYSSWMNREEGRDLKLRDILNDCWHCVSPYRECSGDSETVKQSNESCKIGFNIINQDINEIVNKLKTNQELNLTERYILKNINFKNIEQNFDGFNMATISNPIDRAIIENGLKERTIEVDKDLKIIL